MKTVGTRKRIKDLSAVESDVVVCFQSGPHAGQVILNRLQHEFDYKYKLESISESAPLYHRIKNRRLRQSFWVLAE